jgi:hypothetical protein
MYPTNNILRNSRPSVRPIKRANSRVQVSFIMFALIYNLPRTVLTMQCMGWRALDIQWKSRSPGIRAELLMCPIIHISLLFHEEKLVKFAVYSGVDTLLIVEQLHERSTVITRRVLCKQV